MLAILWRYEVRPEALADFDRAYGPDGDWAVLFGRAGGYLGTELYRGQEGARLTIDRWSGEAEFEAFMAAHRAEYEALDQATEGWTIEELKLGAWEAV